MKMTWKVHFWLHVQRSSALPGFRGALDPIEDLDKWGQMHQPPPRRGWGKRLSWFVVLALDG